MAERSYPSQRSGAVAGGSYPTSKVRGDSREELPKSEVRGGGQDQSGPRVKMHGKMLVLYTFSPPNPYLIKVTYFFSLLLFASQLLVGNLGSSLFFNTVWHGKYCLKQKLLIIIIIFLMYTHFRGNKIVK